MLNTHSRLLGSCFLITVLAFASAAGAQSHVSAPGSLTTGGLWHVTQNIQAPCNGSPLIRVLAHDVTLDLRGYTLECTDGGGPVIEAPGYGNLVVRDGNLRGQGTLIDIDPVLGTPHQWRFRLEKLHLSDFRTGVSARGTSATSIEIRDCDLLSLDAERGLDLENFVGVVVVDTTVRFNRPREPEAPSLGIDIRGSDSVEIRESMVVSAFMGITLSEIDGGRLVGNSLVHNGMGVVLSEGTRRVSVVGNTITGHSESFDGVRVSPGANENAVEANLLLGNRVTGILIAGDDNVVSENRIVGPSALAAISWSGSGNLDGGGNVY
jgi:Right handed beta helix region